MLTLTDCPDTADADRAVKKVIKNVYQLITGGEKERNSPKANRTTVDTVAIAGRSAAEEEVSVMMIFWSGATTLGVSRCQAINIASFLSPGVDHQLLLFGWPATIWTDEHVPSTFTQ